VQCEPEHGPACRAADAAARRPARRGA
jgi:hypothetical protein